MSRLFPFMKKWRENHHANSLMYYSQRGEKVKPIGFDLLDPVDWLRMLIIFFFPNVTDKLIHSERYKEDEI